MRTLMLAFVAVFMLCLLVTPSASAQNGDGPHDSYKYSWFRDADGDGIPNFLDPDWYKPHDGTGYKDTHQNGTVSTATPGDGVQTQTRNTYQYRVQDSYQTSTHYQHENRYQYRNSTSPNLSEGIQLRERDRDRDRDCIEGDRRIRLRDRTCIN